ncbi:MAG TPA: arginase family protein [Thermoanaerobaculia bacterium]|jgi:arginase|nr:arginase family protein [Thermoanaerobaculia bacterium]
MKLTIIQAPYDSGHYGARMGGGPLHLVEKGLLDALEQAGHPAELAPVRLEGFLTEVTSAPLLHRAVAERVAAARAEGRLPVVLSGNCNTAAVGALSGIGPAAVVWMDAHGDLNTPETSPSGFFDGMALALATGRSWRTLSSKVPGFQALDERNLIHLGARDWDLGELNLVATSPLTRLDMETVRDQGIRAALGRALDGIARRVDQVYLHYDLDVLDPSELTANEFSCPGGLTVEEALEVARTAGSHLRIAAVGITAYDPSRDPEERGLRIVSAILQAVAGSIREAF